MSAAAASAVRRSSVELGTAFENRTLRYLNAHLRMSLRRVGRAGDGGVDLRGSWYVPAEAGPSRPCGSGIRPQGAASGGEGREGRQWRRIRVVGQCKAEKKALGPKTVREMEGVVAHLQGVARRARERTRQGSLSATDDLEAAAADEISDPDDGNASPDTDASILAILSSQSGFSKNAMVHATRSHTPLMLVHLLGPSHKSQGPVDEMVADRSDVVVSERGGNQASPIETEAQGVWWNAALAGKAGLLGGKLELRTEILPDPRNGGGGGVDPITGEPMILRRFAVFHRGGRLRRLGPELEE